MQYRVAEVDVGRKHTGLVLVLAEKSEWE